MGKRKISAIEDLATLIQEEFISVRGEISDLREEVRVGFNKLDRKLREMKSDIEALKLRMRDFAYSAGHGALFKEKL